MSGLNTLMQVHKMLYALKREMDSEAKSMKKGPNPTRNFIEHFAKKVKKIIRVIEGD